MKHVFIYGQAGVGKLTIARELVKRTGMALFHNHLVVDAVGAVFPFGSDAFVRLRERFWLDVFAEAVAADRSLVFTFAPETTVAPDFPQRTQALIEAGGGQIHFVRLTAPDDEQERRITAPSRAAFGKLQSLEVLRALRPQFAAAMALMPEALITIDTAAATPTEAAQLIEQAIASAEPK